MTEFPIAATSALMAGVPVVYHGIGRVIGRLHHFLAALALCLVLAVAVLGDVRPVAAEASPAIGVEGTQFKVTFLDGRVLRSPELVGATLIVSVGGETHRLRIDAVERDPDDRQPSTDPADSVWLHTFSVQDTDGGWRNICDTGPDGRRQGFPVAGRATAGGTLEPAVPGVFEIICTSGAQGKCVRFGYRTWLDGKRLGLPAGASLRDAYAACVRMVRADYLGNGAATTKDGQGIDFYDRYGVVSPANDPGQEFEAGWGPEGAVCVHHVRVRENATLAALETAAPRLRGRIGAVCTEDFARAHGALLFNRSAN